jgi:hypothetical protein
VATRAIIIDEKMEKLQKELALIHVTDDFPRALTSKQLNNCHDAALSLCCAIYEYLGMALKYLPRSAVSTSFRLIVRLTVRKYPERTCQTGRGEGGRGKNHRGKRSL